MIGKLTTTSVNDGEVCFDIKIPTKSYLMRASDGWAGVDLAGWTLESSGNYLSDYAKIDVYTKVLPKGKSCLSTTSAMYLFDIQFWMDGPQTSIGVDGDYRKKIDSIIAGAVAGVTAMLKTVQSVYDAADKAHNLAKTLHDNGLQEFSTAKTNWEAAVAALDKAKSACTAATSTRITDQANLNSAAADWNSRKSQNQKELDIIAEVRKKVQELIAIPASSNLELAEHKSGATDLAQTLLQHPSERMQLVGQSLSVLLDTERSSQETTSILQVNTYMIFYNLNCHTRLQLLENLEAKLRAEQNTSANSIQSLTAKLTTSTSAASTSCELSRVRSIEADSAKSKYSISEIAVNGLKASVDRRAADFVAAQGDLKAAQASFKKEQSYLETFKTCGAAASSAWSGSAGSALFLADYFFSYYDWNNGHSPRLGNFFQNAFAAMTSSNKDALVVASLKTDRDSWSLDDNSQVSKHML